jgi:hypothetical protein
MVDRIKTIVADLNADDWKQRDRAEASLSAMGPVAISVLKEVRGSQPPESQQRIDKIVKDLEKQRDGARGSSTKAAPGASAEVPEIQLDVQVDN